MILVTLCLIMCDWRVLIVGPKLFYRPRLIAPILSSAIIFFLCLLSFYGLVNWNCGSQVLGQIGCKSFSLCIALPTFSANNNNDDNNKPGYSQPIFCSRKTIYESIFSVLDKFHLHQISLKLQYLYLEKCWLELGMAQYAIHENITQLYGRYITALWQIYNCIQYYSNVDKAQR